MTILERLQALAGNITDSDLPNIYIEQYSGRRYMAQTAIAMGIDPLTIKSVVFGTLPTTNTETLSAGKTLTANDARIQVLDPGGSSRDITLPDASLMAGDGFYINNAADGEENLVVKSGQTTVGTVNQNEVGYAYSDGSAWYILIGATT